MIDLLSRIDPSVRIAVTGTDTGAGKTHVACALVAALRRRGLRVAAMKPFETGVEPDAFGADALALASAAGEGDHPVAVGPFRLRSPLAPWVAARREGRDVARDLEALTALDGPLARLCAGRDALVVEGAGGLLVPITREATFVDLFRRLGARIVLAAANRLGVINHVRLTAREIDRAGLELAAIALVDVAPPDELDLARATNAEALRDLVAPTPVVAFGHAPHAPHTPTSPAADALVDALLAPKSRDAGAALDAGAAHGAWGLAPHPGPLPEGRGRA